ncbi:unnamed protein product [Strongylus vulgaris]|uniref:Uncharacterized protein n=1 Tax=Strongylus vulgaris TaxID=40348 RepID=A0A3P7IRF9_STRVU|nr:unnamed protein product [Strongylus vulgaris]
MASFFFPIINSLSIFRGLPEWKCETHAKVEKAKICCEDDKRNERSYNTGEPSYGKTSGPHIHMYTRNPNTYPSYSGYQDQYQNKGFYQRVCDNARYAADMVKLYAKRVGRFLFNAGGQVAKVLYLVLLYIWAFLKMFFTTSVPSKTLPSTPRPYQSTKAESQSFNSVEFKPEELADAYEKEQIQEVQEVEAKSVPRQTYKHAEDVRYRPEPEPEREQPPARYAPESQREQLLPRYEAESQPPPPYAAEPSREQRVPVPANREPPVAMPRVYTAAPPVERSAYELDPAASIHGQKFTDTSLDARESRDVKELSPYVEEMNVASHPPPPPPPPPPTPYPKTVRIENVNGRDGGGGGADQWESESTTATRGGGGGGGGGINGRPATPPTKKEPLGIGKLPADVMAELHGTQRMRQEREASIQREMTQSCHPDMAAWKTNDNDMRYDRSATATPFRASSVGPTMRRLEQVVSRLEDTNDNEAQYVFRAKPTDYMLGKSVYTPIEEVEQMRDSINRAKPTDYMLGKSVYTPIEEVEQMRDSINR